MKKSLIGRVSIGRLAVLAVTIKDLTINEKESVNFKKGSYNKKFFRGMKK